jgi:hypothetical protein
MNPLGTLRSSPWLSRALVLVLVLGLAAPLGYAFGLRAWPFYVGVLAGLLLAMGALERLRAGRAEARPQNARKKFRVVAGGKGNGVIDLEHDDTTDKQRWLM